MFHQALRVFIKVSWKLHLSLQNFLINCHGVLIIEWINSCQHLIYQYAEAPPVHWLSMSFIQQDLWCEILGGSTKSVRSWVTEFGKPKICQFKVAILSDQYIFGFQVSINDILSMQVFEHADYLSCIELSFIALEFPLVPQIGEKLTALNEL